MHCGPPCREQLQGWLAQGHRPSNWPKDSLSQQAAANDYRESTPQAEPNPQVGAFPSVLALPLKSLFSGDAQPIIEEAFKRVGNKSVYLPGYFCSYFLLRPCAVQERVMLLCGADVLASFTIPGVWEDPDTLLREHGVACIVREGTDMDALLQHELLKRHQDNIVIVPEPVPNFLSSTLVRKLVAEGRSVRYLVPNEVVDYLAKHADIYNEHLKESVAPFAPAKLPL
eukprot:1160778-Pelagomonas_calceolata.AAC.1